MGKFVKGEGGRPKGRPNKITGDLRQWLTEFIKGNLPQIQQDWKHLAPNERLHMFEKLLKFTLPTLQSVNTTVDFERMTDQQLDTIIDSLKQATLRPGKTK